ncbi:TetR/AcrR family transcriptional regulator [Paenibacillus apiarius]|uniref:TetR/AcrR family transcriptional regulator n=1 Tax=Paenibacillus apiarius TaxID=46240 RepID=A0ABT4DZ52_9BACL|nr:TetR/AcrR family transcriptional regulator [Paenibacillus apiarius]MBN3526672.1 TetR/AcrR family transcriptional regulator [Paenibacillus apiarius]MCY9513089.1 TetR/AcrR family transcriptional regulator [Paenibacillus apiarius]MCY9521553.1 TetR/AcrR family transcriptional regulator [Paenibacillus apiarius]MCY9551707.1 TetR/AcrR family transcriptional regulator [Paenibacillus apiarius]MCY9560505.1 TetR/AcrR family transcriptional regulator [Paenibacillus apiarius]
MKKRELTSNQLIEAAFGLFAQHGIEKTSLAMIAKAVGISKPAIYYHFSSKEELIQRIFEYIFADYRFDHYFRIDQVDADNFGEKLYQGGLQMLPEEGEDEEHYVVMRVLNEFILTAGRTKKYEERLFSMQHEFLDGFRDLLEKGAELGVISPQNIEAKAHMLALVNDNISNYMMMQFKLDYKAIWKEAVNSVLANGGKWS